MKIRPILFDDIPEILAINGQNVPMVGKVDEERMRYLVDTAEHALLVESTGPDHAPRATIAGFCLVFGPGTSYDSVNYRWFAEHSPSAYYLDRVAFREGEQGQGLGTALYAHLEDALRAQGVGAITLEVNIDPPNLQSLGFHRRHGYQEVGQQQTPYGTTVSLQRKELAHAPHDL